MIQRNGANPGFHLSRACTTACLGLVRFLSLSQGFSWLRLRTVRYSGKEQTQEGKDMGVPVIVAKHTHIEVQNYTEHKSQGQLWGHFTRHRPKLSKEGAKVTDLEEINVVHGKEVVILLWGQRTSIAMTLPEINTHTAFLFLGQLDSSSWAHQLPRFTRLL